MYVSLYMTFCCCQKIFDTEDDSQGDLGTCLIIDEERLECVGLHYSSWVTKAKFIAHVLTSSSVKMFSTQIEQKVMRSKHTKSIQLQT